MIEMLGVLAIIGVLSVGGIAGYSKAMSVYRNNKTIDQLTQITASIRALFAGHRQYNALSGNNAMALIQKAHLVPDDMINGNVMDNVYGGHVVIAATKKAAGKKECGTNDRCKAFTVTYDNVPKEACIELSTQNWGQGKTSGLFSIYINETEKLASVGSLSIGEALTACSKSLNNTITWTFY